MKTTIRFAKVRPTAIIPSKTEGNAGYDIYANFDEDYMMIPPHETKLIPTGIASRLENNYYFQIEERGSTGSKGMKKSAGVIDANYNGEWFVAISNVNDRQIYIAKESAKNVPTEGVIVYPYTKAIAQAVLHEVPTAEVIEMPYEELKAMPTDRGNGALGSSGK